MEQSERTGISVVKAQVPLAEMSDYVTGIALHDARTRRI